MERTPGGIRLTAAHLRWIALGAMLLDHLWAMVVPGSQWMTYVGRIAFPIFAFQIAEGARHTSDFRRYALRLLAFALVSEIPFDLMYASTVFYPFHQNVMFTLLLGLLAVRGLDRARRKRTAGAAALGALGLLAAWLAGTIGMVDYGGMGVLTVAVFYVFRGFPLARLGQLACLVLLNMVFFKGEYVSLEILGHAVELQTQGFALLALIPIWLYGGEKGRGGRALQYGSYVFYPLHMLVLYLVKFLA
nr:TraX family protein [uncultured Oscillibacter sp.]